MDDVYNVCRDFQLPLLVTSLVGFLFLWKQLREMRKQNEQLKEQINLNLFQLKQQNRPFALFVSSGNNESGLTIKSKNSQWCADFNIKCRSKEGMMHLLFVVWGYTAIEINPRNWTKTKTLYSDNYLLSNENSEFFEIKNIDVSMRKFFIRAYYSDHLENYYSSTISIEGTLQNNSVNRQRLYFEELRPEDVEEIIKTYNSKEPH